MIGSIGVIGGGAWGTTLALTAARAGRAVKLWARDRDTVAAIDERHENPRYLPGIRLDHVPATDTLAVALRADAIVLAVPAQAIRAVATAAAPYIPAGTPLVIAAKGLERETGQRLSEVIAEVAPETGPPSSPGRASPPMSPAACPPPSPSPPTTRRWRSPSAMRSPVPASAPMPRPT